MITTKGSATFAGKMLLSATAVVCMFFASCSKDDTEKVTIDNQTAIAPNQPGFVKQTPGWSTKTIGRTANGINKQYLLYTSNTYNTATAKWPVIIFLHGVGERGSNINVVRNVGLPKKIGTQADFGFLVVAPQCNNDTWWDVPSLNALYAEIIEKYNVDPTRIYLTGLSMGGFGAWEWSSSNSTKFAAVAPICGGTDHPDRICNLKNVPVWAFHNADDPTVAVQNSRTLVAALKNCGNTRVKYTENATGGHDAWTKAYANNELYTWFKSYHR